MSCLLLFFTEQFSATGTSSASGADSSPPSEGGDTELVNDEDDDIDDSSISETPPSSQIQVKSYWLLAVNQAIVKGVFGRVLNRDNSVNILRKTLTYLKPTGLMSVLAKTVKRSD